MKKNILLNIYQALRQIYEADSQIVWFTFFKNIFEAVFEAVYGIYLIKFIYECIENRVDFRKLFIMVSAFCVFYRKEYLYQNHQYHQYIQHFSHKYEQRQLLEHCIFLHIMKFVPYG